MGRVWRIDKLAQSIKQRASRARCYVEFFDDCFHFGTRPLNVRQRLIYIGLVRKYLSPIGISAGMGMN